MRNSFSFPTHYRGTRSLFGYKKHICMVPIRSLYADVTVVYYLLLTTYIQSKHTKCTHTERYIHILYTHINYI